MATGTAIGQRDVAHLEHRNHTNIGLSNHKVRQNAPTVSLLDRAAEQPRLRAPLPVLRSANLLRRAQNHYRGGVRVANWVEEEYGDHLAGREGALVRAPPDLRERRRFCGGGTRGAG